MSAAQHFYPPATSAAHSVESLYAQHGAPRPWIYWLALLGVGSALGVLPFVPVEVTVRASGLVRPVMERTELKAGISARIARVIARDNDRVTANQPLLELMAGDAEERLARNVALQREKTGIVADLVAMTDTPHEPRQSEGAAPALEPTGPHLVSRLATRAHAQFAAQYEVARLNLIKATEARDRAVKLAAQGIVTEQERDEARYAATRAAADLELLVQQTLAGWQTQLHDEQTAMGQLVSEEKRLREELALSLVRAPIAGTVQGLVGLGAGAFVVAGQSFGYVSPDEPLVVEAYLSPKDIGLVRIGQVVRLQIDAFPYTQWGLLDGRIVDVAADAIGNGQTAAFKVRVQPAALQLRLRNGTTGALRKGMTLTARFVVTRRSLLQVLYEDAAAWLGPQDHPSSS